MNVKSKSWMTPSHQRFGVLACVLASWLVMAAFPAVALADEKASASEPTERQLELNDQGVRAIIQEDYERAIALLEESLVLGDWNITRLNLGRAYQKLGDCSKAKQALESIPSAPQVADPPPDVVEAKAAQFLEELDQMCSEDDYLAQPVQPEDGGATTNSGRKTWGWISVAGGVALVAGGGAMHLGAQAQRDEVRDAPTIGGVRQVNQADIADYEARANTYDTVGLSMAITGGVALGLGTYLLVSSQADAEEPAVSLGVMAGGGMITWTADF